MNEAVSRNQKLLNDSMRRDNTNKETENVVNEVGVSDKSSTLHSFYDNDDSDDDDTYDDYEGCRRFYLKDKTRSTTQLSEILQ